MKLRFDSKTEGSALYEGALDVVRTLHDHGFAAYFAGGCVRDALRGAPAKDIDIATDATPEQVAGLFPAQSLGVGKSFGVMLVLRGKIPYDVATFRTDGGYQDGRHPDSIAYDTAEHDAQRRDFTVNALFYDPLGERLIDYVGGEADLRAGILRTVGDPLSRFREDRLRMLRAVRFATVCGWRIDPATWRAICREAPALACVSAERIRSEFLRMLCEAPKPSEAMNLLADCGLLAVFLPEALALRGCLQDPVWHPEGDVWAHTLKMLDLAPAPRSEALALAVLLHDIGKPATLAVSRKPDGSPWYRTPGHAEAGAKMAPGILDRLKVSRDLREAVTIAVANHMQFVSLPQMRRATVRQMLGRPTIALELELHRLDCLSSHAKLDLYDLAQRYLDEFRQEPVLPPRVVTGDDLLALGYRSGVAMGKVLKTLYMRQLDGASREELVESAIAQAPVHPAAPRAIAFAYAPDAPFPLKTLWERLCKTPGWDVTLIVLPGRYWKPEPEAGRKVLRLVGDCAGNVVWPAAGRYEAMIAPEAAALPGELRASARRLLRV